MEAPAALWHQGGPARTCPRATLIAAEAAATALKAQLGAAATSPKSREQAADAGIAAASAAAAEELASARAEASRAVRQLQAAENRAAELEEEVEELQSQIASNAEAAAAKGEEDEIAEIAHALIEAKSARRTHASGSSGVSLSPRLRASRLSPLASSSERGAVCL